MNIYKAKRFDGLFSPSISFKVLPLTYNISIQYSTGSGYINVDSDTTIQVSIHSQIYLKYVVTILNGQGDSSAKWYKNEAEYSGYQIFSIINDTTGTDVFYAISNGDTSKISSKLTVEWVAPTSAANHMTMDVSINNLIPLGYKSEGLLGSDLMDKIKSYNYVWVAETPTNNNGIKEFYSSPGSTISFAGVIRNNDASSNYTDITWFKDDVQLTTTGTSYTDTNITSGDHSYYCQLTGNSKVKSPTFTLHCNTNASIISPCMVVMKTNGVPSGSQNLYLCYGEDKTIDQCYGQQFNVMLDSINNVETTRSNSVIQTTGDLYIDGNLISSGGNSYDADNLSIGRHTIQWQNVKVNGTQISGSTYTSTLTVNVHNPINNIAYMNLYISTNGLDFYRIFVDSYISNAGQNGNSTFKYELVNSDGSTKTYDGGVFEVKGYNEGEETYTEINQNNLEIPREYWQKTVYGKYFYQTQYIVTPSYQFQGSGVESYYQIDGGNKVRYYNGDKLQISNGSTITLSYVPHIVSGSGLSSTYSLYQDGNSLGEATLDPTTVTITKNTHFYYVNSNGNSQNLYVYLK